jgi:thiol-disulfide isomerase/thioredoxin
MKFGKNVKNLTENDFVNYKIKNNNKKGIVVFYATWCGYCQMLVPEYKKLGDMKKINVYAIDIDKNPNLIQYFNIEGYPTIKRVNKLGEIKETYTGERNVKDMLSYILNQKGGYKKKCKGITLGKTRCKRNVFGRYKYCKLHRN